MDAEPTYAEILSIGDELLRGDILDTNASYLARRLLSLGIRSTHQQTVGDDPEEITAAFRLALSRAQVVLATGGLGPTDDDLTVEAAARALGLELEHREEVMDQMAERLKRPKEAFSEANRKQARVPRGAQVLQNHWGTAPGIGIETADRRSLFLMPGVPGEMKGLFETHIFPQLEQRFGGGRVIVTRFFHAYGVPESGVGQQLKALMRPGLNPDVGTCVRGGSVTVRAVASAPTQSAAEALLAPVGERIREALKEGFLGEDDQTLVPATARALLERRKSVAFAESCTAGLAAATLAEYPGISAVLKEGVVVYSNEAKVRLCGVRPETLAAHGAVSGQTAGELAEGIRRVSGADFGAAVTGIAGPEGGTPEKPVGLIWFGLAGARGTQRIERRWPGLDRNALRERAAHTLLDLVRRAALES